MTCVLCDRREIARFSTETQISLSVVLHSNRARSLMWKLSRSTPNISILHFSSQSNPIGRRSVTDPSPGSLDWYPPEEEPIVTSHGDDPSSQADRRTWSTPPDLESKSTLSNALYGFGHHLRCHDAAKISEMQHRDKVDDTCPKQRKSSGLPSQAR